MRKYLFLIGILYCVFSCDKDDDGWLAPNKEYHDDFEQMEDFWVTSETVDPSRYELVPDPIDSGNQVIRFSLFPDDFISNGKRNEFKFYSKDQPGFLVRYSFKFMLPKSFFKNRTQKDWLMLHQWHDEPPNGKDWTDYNMETRPPVNLALDIGPDDHIQLIFNYGLWNKEKKEVQSIPFNEPLQPEKWYTFENTIFWSFDDSGYAQPRINGNYLYDSPKGKVHGANVYNDVGNYFKMGPYGNKKSADTIAVYYDEFRYRLSDSNMVE